MLEPKPSHKVLVGLVELDVSLQLVKHKDFQQVVDRLALEELDRFQVEKMVEQEGVGVSKTSNTADENLVSLLSAPCCLPNRC